MARQYRPYMRLEENGEIREHVFAPLDLLEAYNEAVRLKEDYHPVEAGVKVYTSPIFKIISWAEGKYFRGNGTHLYTLKV